MSSKRLSARRLACKTLCTGWFSDVACICRRPGPCTWSSTIVLLSATARCCVKSMNERKMTTDSSTWHTPHRRPSDDCSLTPYHRMMLDRSRVDRILSEQVAIDNRSISTHFTVYSLPRSIADM